MWGTGRVFDAYIATSESHLGHKRLENPYGIKTFARFGAEISPTILTRSPYMM